jgi:acetoacetate decarboxylase
MWHILHNRSHKLTDPRIQNGNNVPLHAPLFEDPFVPYHCPQNKTLSVYCRGDRQRLAAHLAHTPFQLASEFFLVYISDFSNCDKVAFMDAGIMLAIDYKGRKGGCVLYEYENDDSAMAAGRELWGYPKKFAEIELTSNGDGVSGKVVRKGQTIIDISGDFSIQRTVPSISLAPHFNLQVNPGPAGEVLSRRVIERDTSSDFVTEKTSSGAGRATLVGTRQDPFQLLGEFEVIAANYTVGDFHATETNGWGKIVETL